MDDNPGARIENIDKPPSIDGNSSFFLPDLLIENLEKNEKIRGFNLIRIVALGYGRENVCCLTLTSAFPAKWQASGSLPLPTDIKQLTLVAHTDDFGVIGYIHLTKCELEARLTARAVNHRGSAELKSETDSSSILKCDVPRDVLISGEDVGGSSSGGTTEEAALLADIGNYLKERFEDTENVADVRAAIFAFQRAIYLAPPSHASLPFYYSNLGSCFTSRFENTGDVADTQEAVSAHRKAIQLTPPDHSDLSSRYSNLGLALAKRFECSEDIADIQQALSAFQRAVQLAPPGHELLSSYYNNIGTSFLTCFENTGDLKDIQEAITAHQKAVKLAPPDDKGLYSYYNDLGMAFGTRFEYTGDIADVREAISAQHKSVDIAPSGHKHVPALYNNLGTSFANCFRYTGSISDIRGAISAQQRAVQLTPLGHEDLSFYYTNLGSSFLSSFERTGNAEDIREAISAHQNAVQHAPPGHSDVPFYYNNLGTSLQSRFEHMGDIADIEEAITAQQKAIQLTPPSQAAFVTVNLSSYHNNLGLSFLDRFEVTGELIDIQEAITALHKAVQLTPSGHASLSSRYNNLGSSFLSRFRRTGEFVDVEEAIAAHQKAVELTPSGHARLPLCYSNLGSSFEGLFSHTQDLDDIRKAINAHRKAVELTPPGHAELPLRHNKLGISFRLCFALTKDMADIQEAFYALRKAVELCPSGHPDLFLYSNNLGISLTNCFDHTGDIAYLQQAISTLQQAVELTPSGHSSLVSCHVNLGSSFLRLCDNTKDNNHLLASAHHFQLAATSPTGSSANRLHAAQCWAQLCQRYDPEQSIPAYDRAIELVSLIAGLEQTMHQRHEHLAETSDLSLEAAAMAFSLGRADKALEWLEQGRCIVWSQLNSLRTPLGALRTYNPDLADRVLCVSKALENAGSRELPESGARVLQKLEQSMSLEEEATVHVKLAKEWDELLKTVRAIPEFENFLRPSSQADLVKHLPDSGRVIIVNVHKTRCDALVLTRGFADAIHIPLSDFSEDKAQRLRASLQAALVSLGLRMRGSGDVNSDVEVDADATRYGRPAGRGVQPTAIIETVLHDLWQSVVKPILDQLQYSASIKPQPRIWWCATGPLAFLPLHAAGIYAPGQQSTIADYVVSSYTPTVTALAERVRAPGKPNDHVGGLLMVSLPDTPGQLRIPGATKEVHAVQRQVKDRGLKVLTLEGEAATVKAGMENMQDYDCIHFACHAYQDATEPLKSGFFFHDGLLDLSMIIKNHSKTADLAFLSACQTSTGDEKLSEEAVHLAAGMLAAGYRGVVATMWSIQDRYAPEVAEDFYKRLLKNVEEEGGKGINGSSAAYALHRASQRLREKLGDRGLSFFTWVPYVHYGL